VCRVTRLSGSLAYQTRYSVLMVGISGALAWLVHSLIIRYIVSYQVRISQWSINSPMPVLHQRRSDPIYMPTQIHLLRSRISIIALHKASESLLRVKTASMPLPISLMMRASETECALTRVLGPQQCYLHILSQSR
jgi:hypothetical protein